MRRSRLLAIIGVFLCAFAGAPAAQAATPVSFLDGVISPLNNSGAAGRVFTTLNSDGSLTVEIISWGLAPNLVHAQHIHGGATGNFMCPTMAADSNKDGILTATEAGMNYGPVFLALTTTGDASAASALAVDRMPKADANGFLYYKRTFTAAQLPAGLLANLDHLHVVQHGVDLNKNGTYDFSAGVSDLNPALPQEATAPATCTDLMGMPMGGVETGVADENTSQTTAMGLGAGALLLAAATAFVLRRRELN